MVYSEEVQNKASENKFINVQFFDNYNSSQYLKVIISNLLINNHY